MKPTIYYHAFLLMNASLAFIWLRSAFGKVMSGTFVENIPNVLTTFASNNPYGWYRSFLEGVAIPNAKLFGISILIGEVFVAVALTAATLYLLLKHGEHKLVLLVLALALFGGLLMNLNFWLASSWMSPSSDSINLLMFLLEATGLIIVVYTLRSHA